MKNRLTKVEKFILENTNKQFKYIARNIYGDLFIYTAKPIKLSNSWYHCGCNNFRSFNHLFQNIKWEDEEPYKFR